MVGALLTRGMLIGILAGILSFGFLKLVGEPPVDRAIVFETAMDEAKDNTKADHAMSNGMTMPKQDSEPELVSRSVQSGIGLFTGVAVYNTAFGGLFALVFAFAYRRMGDFDPKNDVRAAGNFRHCRRLYRPEPEIPGQPAIGWRSRYDRHAHRALFCDDCDFTRRHDRILDAPQSACPAIRPLERGAHRYGRLSDRRRGGRSGASRRQRGP
jgi:hypothetical protein